MQSHHPYSPSSSSSLSMPLPFKAQTRVCIGRRCRNQLRPFRLLLLLSKHPELCVVLVDRRGRAPLGRARLHMCNLMPYYAIDCCRVTWRPPPPPRALRSQSLKRVAHICICTLTCQLRIRCAANAARKGSSGCAQKHVHELKN